MAEAWTSQDTSLKLFLHQNKNLDLMKEARDGKGGIYKLIDVAIFGFLLFSPALPIIPTMEQPAVVAVLWILIVVIMWCKIEYSHRAELWFVCLCRGIIVDFPKTHKLKGWLCQAPMFFAYSFLLIFGAVTYIGLDPHFKFEKSQYFLQAILAIVALAFVLLLTKSFVTLESAPSLLTLNMVIALFQDVDFLKAKGFKVVPFTHIQHFVEAKRAAKDATFSWDELHCLDCSSEKTGRISLIGGTRVWMFLRQFKNAGEELDGEELDGASSGAVKTVAIV